VLHVTPYFTLALSSSVIHVTLYPHSPPYPTSGERQHLCQPVVRGEGASLDSGVHVRVQHRLCARGLEHPQCVHQRCRCLQENPTHAIQPQAASIASAGSATHGTQRANPPSSSMSARGSASSVTPPVRGQRAWPTRWVYRRRAHGPTLEYHQLPCGNPTHSLVTAPGQKACVCGC
jgi:hypothetical protein